MFFPFPSPMCSQPWPHYAHILVPSLLVINTSIAYVALGTTKVWSFLREGKVAFIFCFTKYILKIDIHIHEGQSHSYNSTFILLGLVPNHFLLGQIQRRRGIDILSQVLILKAIKRISTTSNRCMSGCNVRSMLKLATATILPKFDWKRILKLEKGLGNHYCRPWCSIPWQVKPLSHFIFFNPREFTTLCFFILYCVKTHTDFTLKICICP